MSGLSLRVAIGAVYRAAGDPKRKLQVTSVTGNLVTSMLVGTSQTYAFDDAKMTFGRRTR